MMVFMENFTRTRIFVSIFFLVIAVRAIFLTTNISSVLSDLHNKLFNDTEPPIASPIIVEPQDEYNIDTCTRLDSQFEFESPPDFTKLGIESWTDCKDIVALKGWKVEHCTAPGSTWPDYENKLDSYIDNSNSNSHNGSNSSNNSSINYSSFLHRPKPIPEGQRYTYTSPPKTFSVPVSPLLSSPLSSSSSSSSSCLGQNCSVYHKNSRPTQCNPSGYFRVQRLDVPVSNYTYGSASVDPSARCRNTYLPISLNETTRSYIEDFVGPDAINVYLDGPEKYIASQQINLGNCSYAIPYVLSQPGRFWVTKIVHAHQNFESLNENFQYIPNFAPKYIGANILPDIPPAPNATVWKSGPARGEREWEKYRASVANVHSFTVCEGCPQYTNSSSLTEYQDLPVCSFSPYVGSREYGVHAGYKRISNIEDLGSQTYGWVASRPRCRHVPQLIALLQEENFQKYSNSNPTIPEKVYGSPPPLPTLHDFINQHAKVKQCLNLTRNIYFAGDSHIRQLFSDLIIALDGTQSHEFSFRGWGTHQKDIDGLRMRQDFDSWFHMIQSKLRYMLNKPQLDASATMDEWDLLKDYDTIVLNYGAWPMAGFKVGVALTTEEFLAQMKPIIWDLAAVRYNRQENFKRTRKGYSDLRIIWLGQVPWPDTRTTPDMRTNPKIKVWDLLVDEEIEKVNDYYKEQGGMIDRVNYFPKVFPYRQLSLDGAHHSNSLSVDTIIQVLIHKLDLCQLEYKPILL